MSNFDFIKGAKEYIYNKAESFLKNNGIDETLDGIKKTIELVEPNFEDYEYKTQADCVTMYIEELMNAVLNEVSKKNGTTFKEEYDNFRIHYNQ